MKENTECQKCVNWVSLVASGRSECHGIPWGATARRRLLIQVSLSWVDPRQAEEQELEYHFPEVRWLSKEGRWCHWANIFPLEKAFLLAIWFYFLRCQKLTWIVQIRKIINTTSPVSMQTRALSRAIVADLPCWLSSRLCGAPVTRRHLVFLHPRMVVLEWWSGVSLSIFTVASPGLESPRRTSVVFFRPAPLLLFPSLFPVEVAFPFQSFQVWIWFAYLNC